jgi:nucleotide-binding universal stress UspA family protein
MINHILLATDGTGEALKAEDYALYLARISGAALTVLYVDDNRLMHYGQVDQLVTEKTKEQFITYISEKNQAERCRVLDNFSKKAQQEGVLFSSIIRSGAPDKEIAAAASENSVDLLIIGGRGAAGHSILPSSGVAGKLLKKSPCPIFVAG